MLRRNTDAVDDDDAEAVARAGNLGARAHEQRVMASRAASMARSAVAANLGATGRQQKRRTLLSADERAVANEARRMKRRRQLDAVLQRVHVQHGHGMQSTTTTTSQAANITGRCACCFVASGLAAGCHGCGCRAGCLRGGRRRAGRRRGWAGHHRRSRRRGGGHC